jgi:hypothetical protein
MHEWKHARESGRVFIFSATAKLASAKALKIKTTGLEGRGFQTC